jgi:hypothetical protein
LKSNCYAWGYLSYLGASVYWYTLDMWYAFMIPETFCYILIVLKISVYFLHNQYQHTCINLPMFMSIFLPYIKVYTEDEPFWHLTEYHIDSLSWHNFHRV